MYGRSPRLIWIGLVIFSLVSLSLPAEPPTASAPTDEFEGPKAHLNHLWARVMPSSQPVEAPSAPGRYAIVVVNEGAPGYFLLDTCTGRTWKYGLRVEKDGPIGEWIWRQCPGGPAPYDYVEHNRRENEMLSFGWHDIDDADFLPVPPQDHEIVHPGDWRYRVSFPPLIDDASVKAATKTNESLRIYHQQGP